MDNLSSLKRLEVRSVWPNEASNFTPWLAKNLDLLGETIGIELELVRMEEGVGSFSLDILAKEVSGNEKVVIENQYGDSDHDHLGKLLTYASGVQASVVIWITETFKDEHRQTLDWLNQRTDLETKFFGVSVEVLQIEDSKPAVNFRLLAFPNNWGKTQKSQSDAPLTERQIRYKEFFQSLIDELRDQHNFTSARVAFPQNWYLFSAGTSGIGYGGAFGVNDRARTEIYLDSSDAEKNKAIFDSLYSERHSIEAEVGEPLDWDRMDNAKTSRIALYRPGSIIANEDELEEVRTWMIKNLLLFKEVFGDRLDAVAK